MAVDLDLVRSVEADGDTVAAAGVQHPDLLRWTGGVQTAVELAHRPVGEIDIHHLAGCGSCAHAATCAVPQL